MDTFSERLADLMSQRRFNNSSLGKELGVTHSTVARWLTGSMPGGDTLQKLARTLGVDAQFLITGEGIGSSSVREDAASYGSKNTPDDWEHLFYKVANDSDTNWLLDRLDQLSKDAADGDANAARCVRIITPIIRKRVKLLSEIQSK